ncbi:hypothetical protein UlMin_000141 [Ulmus minor]
MGNSTGKLGRCFAGAGEISRRHDIAVVLSNPLDDEGLGHSFCYIRPEPAVDEKPGKTTTFRAISGASVSANTFTPLSTSLIDTCPYSNGFERAAVFESSTLFASIPLQPVQRVVSGSGSIERGFLSGPIERSFTSGPIEKKSDEIEMSFNGEHEAKLEPERKKNLMNIFRRAISSSISRGHKSIVAPIKGGVSAKESDSEKKKNGVDLSSHVSLNVVEEEGDLYSLESKNLQWAQGKAGEDRVHIVISERNGWVFVGIYDGFNGPDAPDYLLSNLYPAVHKELKGLLWDDTACFDSLNSEKIEQTQMDDPIIGGVGEENYQSKRRWKCEWDRERVELDRKLKENLNSPGSNGVVEVNHSSVLKALSKALRTTEEAYFDVADKMLTENPELALMGSCVLVMLMKGEDVYLMNVGDSRAILARKDEPDLGIGRNRRELDPIHEETHHDLDDEFDSFSNLTSIQLTMDHSTYVEEEVERIKNEHPDDASAVMNERVKGYLKVTRAFGAGFLKQPKWNNALLEMFRIDYVGTSPYITCLPSLYHHKLSSRDRFLILSSDGLYQYFTNEEAVSEVELFIASFPEGDPAQHLIQEVLFRAARKAGMDFHELLDIPQGERRRYHDDVSIIVISLEGRIWRSSV